ncbi:MAG: division/cell wall cluster transcriptional repressor MraZ [Candidatus Glassbacteria bacterium]|nr:division/cell wall cluster transcriptional repressor MraZ [Candidatus Glassbacteria bacterium]
MKHWGRVKNNLDSKGRVSLPARFRRDDVEYYVLNQGFDGCLFLFTPEQYEKTLEKIQERTRNKKTLRHYMRKWTMFATDIRLDQQGRLLIPAELLNLGGLQKEVIFQGTNDRIELWDPQAQEKYVSEIEEKYSVTFEDIAEILD